MLTRGNHVLLFGPPLLLWALLLVTAARHGARPALHAPATQAIPSGPMLLATLDLSRRDRPAFHALLGEGWSAELQARCGEDPLAPAAELALAMPAAAAEGEFGLALAGSFQVKRVVSCATRVIEGRGGRPVVLQDGPFSLISDVASRGEGVVAIKEGGPLLLGGLAYVRRMIATAARREASVESDARHVALRSEVGEAMLVATLLPSQDLGERLRAEAGVEQGGLAGVLGLGVALSADDPAELRLAIGCDGAASCQQAQAGLRGLQGSEGLLLARLPGLKQALAGAEIGGEGPTARVRLRAPLTLLSALGSGVRAWLREGRLTWCQRADRRRPRGPGRCSPPR